MRTAILGGTFDPVHVGHLLMADEVLSHGGYERILFVPARVPPHKSHLPAASPAQRLAMLELATADRPEFAVNAFEIERNGLSYTVDTLRHLTETGAIHEKPGLIIGEDLVSGFEQWRDPDAVAALADLILVRRPGAEGATFHRPHTLLDNLVLEISSTEIRDRIARGVTYRYLVLPSVYNYIEQHRLYR